MSLITFVELCEKIAGGLLVAPSSNPPPFNKIPIGNINAASVDVRLGQTFLREVRPDGVSLQPSNYVSLFDKGELPMVKETLAWGERLYLQPGEFILAQTVEEFYLPNNIAAEFRLKSSVARAGLDQALAVWCDPGWNGSVLTIELRNNTRYHVLVLEAGMKIGQVVFFKGEPVPDEASYAVRGQYNNDKSVTANKGVK
jgi:deoxycytidine triphosphate deaminase